jgi:polyisoprenoid-binding protein YceI
MTTATTQLPTGTWHADPIHSSAGFRIRHFGVSTFRAGFGEIRATYTGEGDEARLVGVVPVESISITQPDFRGHMLAEDFFDAERHPEVRFESTAIRLDGEAIEVDGELTIKGNTRSVTARGTAAEPADDPFGGRRFSVDLTAELDRREFGLNYQAELPSGKLALDYSVTLEVSLELVQQA